jgi:hypothetical protein
MLGLLVLFWTSPMVLLATIPANNVVEHCMFGAALAQGLRTASCAISLHLAIITWIHHCIIKNCLTGIRGGEKINANNVGYSNAMTIETASSTTTTFISRTLSRIG